VLLELGPMMRDASLNLNPAVLLANALSAFALNLVRPARRPAPRAAQPQASHVWSACCGLCQPRGGGVGTGAVMPAHHSALWQLTALTAGQAGSMVTPCTR